MEINLYYDAIVPPSVLMSICTETVRYNGYSEAIIFDLPLK